MPAKIRLQRHGRKRYAYYHIVIADSRAPRDGSNIERIGSYNPNTNPATIDLDFDKALTWLANGAQPTDTVRAILSYKGVMYKKHLLGGVAKGAFTAEEAKFEAWVAEKANKVQAKKDGLVVSSESSRKSQLEMEAKKNAERANAIAKRNAEAAAAARAASAPAPVVEEEVAEEAAPEETEG